MPFCLFFLHSPLLSLSLPQNTMYLRKMDIINLPLSFFFFLLFLFSIGTWAFVFFLFSTKAVDLIKFIFFDPLDDMLLPWRKVRRPMLFWDFEVKVIVVMIGFGIVVIKSHPDVVPRCYIIILFVGKK